MSHNISFPIISFGQQYHLVTYLVVSSSHVSRCLQRKKSKQTNKNTLTNSVTLLNSLSVSKIPLLLTTIWELGSLVMSSLNSNLFC